jgi:hypothetical protein
MVPIKEKTKAAHEELLLFFFGCDNAAPGASLPGKGHRASFSS